MSESRQPQKRSPHTPPNSYRRRAPYAKKKRGRRALTLTASVMALAAIAAGICYGLFGGGAGQNAFTSSMSAFAPSAVSHSAAPVSSVPPPPPPEPTERRVRFSAVGDNLIHEAIYRSAEQQAGGEGYDFTFCYEHVTDFLAEYDINWINQETLVNDELPASTYPAFSTPGELGRAAYGAGWRVFALSNNHSLDKGAAGIAATLRYWEGMPDDTVTTGLYTGREDDSGIGLHEVNGITVAYVAFAENSNGIAPSASQEAFLIYTTALYESADPAAMEYKVRRARELADVVVVSAHWGVEYSHTPTGGQRGLAQQFADWGADIIIGTHPHVIQPVEWVEAQDGRRVPVAYSLGNCLSAQNEPPRMVGLALTCDMAQTVDADGTEQRARIENVKVYPTVTQYEYRGGAYYENSRMYMYGDYTDELAAAHAVPGGISRAYIAQLAQSVVSDEFLILE